MTAREALHQILDELPDERIVEARACLEDLCPAAPKEHRIPQRSSLPAEAPLDRLAETVADQYRLFQAALARNRRSYPAHEFQEFAAAVRQYVEANRSGGLLHRHVVRSVHGLVEALRHERKTVSGELLYEADRLECLLFRGYDPYFEGDEPPGI